MQYLFLGHASQQLLQIKVAFNCLRHVIILCRLITAHPFRNQIITKSLLRTRKVCIQACQYFFTHCFGKRRYNYMACQLFDAEIVTLAVAYIRSNHSMQRALAAVIHQCLICSINFIIKVITENSFYNFLQCCFLAACQNCHNAQINLLRSSYTWD